MRTDSMGICCTVPEGSGRICADCARVTMRRLASLLAGSVTWTLKTLMGSRSRGTCPARTASGESMESSWSSWSLRRSLPRSSDSSVFHTSMKAFSSRSHILFHQRSAPMRVRSLGRSVGSCNTRAQSLSGRCVKPRPRLYQKSRQPPRRLTPRKAPTQATASAEKSGSAAKEASAAGSSSTAACAACSQGGTSSRLARTQSSSSALPQNLAARRSPRSLAAATASQKAAAAARRCLGSAG
mmetsp:Transcript_64056/g.206343  ORF Transcript_64056/g.206343 Transcript_64056/m.206343 type:complete len:241 (-) Transcript_64056:512-1234(-)